MADTYAHGAYPENADGRTFSALEKTSGAAKGKKAMTNEEVRMWRQMHRNGEITTKQIREMTGLSMETVARMLRGDTYASVKDAVLPREMPAAESEAMLARLTEVQKRKDAGLVADPVTAAVQSTVDVESMSPQTKARLAGMGLLKKVESLQPEQQEAKEQLGGLTAEPEEPNAEDMLNELYGR
jgi:hypothetical protein